MNEAFIWLSGLRFIDKQNYLIENKPIRGLRKKYNIPDVNWLRVGPKPKKHKVSNHGIAHMINTFCHTEYTV